MLPDGPPCMKCEHRPCPFCLDWCDHITEDDELCCDGQCVYAPGEHEAWIEQMNALRRGQAPGEHDAH